VLIKQPDSREERGKIKSLRWKVLDRLDTTATTPTFIHINFIYIIPPISFVPPNFTQQSNIIFFAIPAKIKKILIDTKFYIRMHIA
jgi:hypothetical protein